MFLDLISLEKYGVAHVLTRVSLMELSPTPVLDAAPLVPLMPHPLRLLLPSAITLSIRTVFHAVSLCLIYASNVQYMVMRLF